MITTLWKVRGKVGQGIQMSQLSHSGLQKKLTSLVLHLLLAIFTLSLSCQKDQFLKKKCHSPQNSHAGFKEKTKPLTY